MKAHYKMKDKEGNVVIIDKKGKIRYFSSGKIKDQEIEKIKELLKKIGDEKYDKTS
jgi:predicted transcriptional regulator